jgi:aminoglycoside 6'-N-acetyltransferase I
MTVRKAAPDDHKELQRLSQALSTVDDCPDLWDEQVFVFDHGCGHLGGYISVSKRPWTEGSDAQPVAHVEAWFVDPAIRRQGIGARLMSAAEHWAQLKGFTEICSDANINNIASIAAHQRMGFEPTLRLQYFRKTLPQAARRVAGQG